MTILIFIIILSILVFVHEFGHFITAKRAGMKVEEFGFGFPPRIFGIKKGETTYSINWIPFGGFVKILGENGEDKDDPRSFAAAKAKIRAKVIVAGVVMNILLAMLLLAIGNAVGIRVGLIDEELTKQAGDVRVQIVQIAQGSPAEEAGITVLDEIVGLSVDGQKIQVTNVEQVQEFINSNLGKEIVLETRSGDRITERN
ncbi:MAG: site-2 protease family protein, partial [Candidatus Paceibacterota bacterium]